jgi:hypothetical protein
MLFTQNRCRREIHIQFTGDAQTVIDSLYLLEVNRAIPGVRQTGMCIRFPGTRASKGSGLVHFPSIVRKGGHLGYNTSR